MSFRSLRYEDFDQVTHVAIESSLNGAGDATEREARPYRGIEIVRRECFEAGRTEGFAEGRRAALEEAEVRLAHDLPNLLVNLGGALAEMDRVKRTCERDAALLAGTALRQMLPIIAERGIGAEAAALVAEMIANVPGPLIEVRTSPRTREAIERRCDRLPSGITLITDPEVPEGGVRCAWANGQARFDGAAMKEAILTILDRCLPPAQPRSLEQAPAQKED